MTGKMTIPVGPQHPLLKEPLSIELDLAGERIVDARVSIGYVHRGIEKLCQQRTFAQNVALVERICGICSHAHTTTYCQAVESLMGVEVPARAVYIRALFCELERIHSHLLWMGVLAEAIGFTTVFMYAWRDREIVLDMMEQLSGGRIAHAANMLGGVRVDLSPQAGRDVMGQLGFFREQMGLFRQMVERDRSFHRRTQGVGRMTLEMAHQLGVVGPLARAAGCSVDLRHDAPYGAYPWLDWRVVSGGDGDVWSVAEVRMQEIEQSISLCTQVVQGLPDGPLSVDVPRRVPAGETVARSEAPRGELVYYVSSDGGERPARVKVRTPSLPALLALESLLPGLETADLAAVIAGADLCIACADR
jgi:Ni,Fe-hydrogenase III large subunit